MRHLESRDIAFVQVLWECISFICFLLMEGWYKSKVLLSKKRYLLFLLEAKNLRNLCKPFLIFDIILKYYTLLFYMNSEIG